MAKKIFLTGATGFLGSYILQLLLEKGYHVRALRRQDKVPAWIPASFFEQHAAGLEWVEGDILDVVALEEAMEGVDAVVHSAALVSFHKHDQQALYQINVEGTANVVNMALEQGVKRLVHISSVAALGRTAGGELVNEEKKWEESPLNTHYAKSKFKAELQVWRGMAEGLEAVILNPSTILGYGDWNSSSCAIFKNAYREFPWYTPGLNGFVDVKDVALAVWLALESEISEERYIINGDNWPFRQLQETMAAGFSKRGPRREASRFLLQLAWRLERIKSVFTGHRPLLTRESARVAISQTRFDNRKFLQAFPGFTYTPLETSIREACRNYLEQLR